MAEEVVNQEPILLNFAQTDGEAQERATTYQDNDPLESIPRSLLSSAEIDDYVRITGMISPILDRR